MDWTQVKALAADFEPILQKKWPAYLEEMKGIAEGAGLETLDIIALNVRTEINFGMFSEGCTAMSWKTDSASYLAQNWDWQTGQQHNIIALSIAQPGKPSIRTMTEAGIIGKIGFNSAGVGVCLNAIKAKGMDPTRLPCHLGLRMVLESQSVEDAVERLQKYGVASSCHMLVADQHGSVGLEWSSIDLQKVQMNASRQVFHSNHYLLPHEGVVDTVWLVDSPFRVSRVEQICKTLPPQPSMAELEAIFHDEVNAPASICRTQTEVTGSATLFNIVMDLEKKMARVKLGRPTEPLEALELSIV